MSKSNITEEFKMKIIDEAINFSNVHSLFNINVSNSKLNTNSKLEGSLQDKITKD
jgi:hypothetical protein